MAVGRRQATATGHDRGPTGDGARDVLLDLGHGPVIDQRSDVCPGGEAIADRKRS